MQVLFYVEPLVERELPFWKSGWVGHHVRHMVQALRESGIQDDQLALVISDALVEEATSQLPGLRIGTLSHADFVPALGCSALEVATSRYRGTVAAPLLAKLGERIRSAVSGFQPSVVVALAPAPELYAAWPEVPVVYWEYGMFSRMPYPETAYIDPVGMFQKSALGTFSDQIRHWSPDTDALTLLGKIREHYRPRLFGRVNPIMQALEPRLSKFRYRVLLALQFSDYYAYDAHATFRSQYDLLIATLEAIPRDVAVIAVEHPEHPLFDERTFSYLAKIYPNLIWEPSIREVYAASQCALACVDSVVTVSSSVGWQAALWGKRLIVVGSSHLDIVADSHRLDDAVGPPLAPDRHDVVLAWLLSRYFMPWEVLLHEGRLEKYLMRAIESNGAGISFEWFKPIASPDDLEAAFCTGGYPVLRSNSSTRGAAAASREEFLHVAFYLAKEHQQFAEEHRVSIVVDPFHPKVHTIPIGELLPGARRLRFDPSEQPDIVKVSNLTILDSEGQVVYSWDGSVPGPISPNLRIIRSPDSAPILICGDNDPWLVFDLVDDAQEVRVEIRRMNAAEIGLELEELVTRHKVQSAELIQSSDELRAQLAELKRAMMGRDTQFITLEDVLRARDAQIAGLNHSAAEREVCLSHLVATVADRDVSISGLNQAVSARDAAILDFGNLLAQLNARVNKLCETITERDKQNTNLAVALRERDEQIAKLALTVNDRDVQITCLNQAVANRDARVGELIRSLAEKDTKIALFSQRLTERDGQIGSLTYEVNERDTRIGAMMQIIVERDAQAINYVKTQSTRDSEISELNRAQEMRDLEIANLAQTVTARDALVIELQRLQTDREAQLANLDSLTTTLRQEQLNLLSSASWRITRPLRAARKYCNKLLTLFPSKIN